MPPSWSTPGTYIEELPGGVPRIAGATTSETAFVDRFSQGPVETPTRVTSFDEFTQIFGGLHSRSLASYALLSYFANGGTVAWVVRADLPADQPASTSAIRAAVTTAMETLADTEPLAFNLLCLPVAATLGEEIDDLVDAAATLCEQRRAFLLVDPPVGDDSSSASAIVTWLTGTDGPAATRNAAIYWPRVTIADPLADGAPREIGPSGTVAGVFARTDATRGVWKAPAGVEATTLGVEPAVRVDDADSDVLNPAGVNALRTFPGIGAVVWGSRTLVGADPLTSEWKYVPVRRTALYIERSLVAGLEWAVFQPNDEALWSRIRRQVGSFLQELFNKGAFQGTTPKDAYVVRCDQETTSPGDIDAGVVNILVGFAPLRPAEFVLIRIQQRAVVP